MIIMDMILSQRKSKEQANYKDEIEKIVKDKPGINFILWETDLKGYFTIDKLFKSSTIKGHSIFICGPEAMREGYIKQLNEKGISIEDIHYEEYDWVIFGFY